MQTPDHGSGPGPYLMVPAVWGYLHTRVNYDILTYLPDSIETIQGQNILMDDFGTGAITMLIVEDKEDKDIVALKHEIEKVEHVKRVLWYDSFADITVPKEMLPQKVRDAFINGNATMLAVIYDSSTSSDESPIQRISRRQRNPSTWLLLSCWLRSYWR